MRFQRTVAFCIPAAAIACAVDTPASTATVAPPSVRIIAVDSNATNVLGAFVRVTTANADSVQIRFHIVAAQGDSATPAALAADSCRLPVYGLLSGHTYVLRAVAFGQGGVAVSDSATMTTGALPQDLPAFSASGTASTPGFTVFAVAKYGLVIDNTGRVVWYRAFLPNGPGLNFIAQSNGRYAAQPAAAGGPAPQWIEIDPSGAVTRSFGCVGLPARFHDLIREPDDSYWLICDDTRTMDLSALGGRTASRVTAVEVQHVDADGSVRFRWNAFDHFDLADLDSATLSAATVNWTHANAIALRADGLLLLSTRNLSEITAIDTHSGAVVWRLGGKHDEFGLAECCTPMFARQHGLRIAADGSLIFLDNSGMPGNSRVERYAIDAASRRARLNAAFSAAPPVIAMQGGSVQELPTGNLLAAFGDGHRVEELDVSGRVVWRLNGDPGYVFRAQHIASLYAPGIGTVR